MNDRFKFRFWREHYDGKFTLECADLMSIDGSADPYNVGEGDVYCYHPGETIIEQCTGLKDKNGKLIFEGDVVLLDKYNYSILWNDCWCIFRERSEQITHVNSSCLEVIGNIHENPELLK